MIGFATLLNVNCFAVAVMVSCAGCMLTGILWRRGERRHPVLQDRADVSNWPESARKAV